jgi:hypothetical protein
MQDTLQVVTPTEFSAETVGKGPMKITYYLSAQVTIVTSVIGDARNIASVTIMDGTATAWSGTMVQATPDIDIPYALQLSSVKIETGASFHLTIPTGLQNGNVMMHATIDQQGTSTPVNVQIASWPASGNGNGS